MKKQISIPRLNLWMRNIFFLAVSFGIAKVSAQNRSRQTREHDSFSNIFKNQVQQNIDNYRRQIGAPGIAVALYENGKTCIFTSGDQGDNHHTPVTGETDFATGSIQKTYTATLLAIAINQGKATINDPAAKYLVGDHNKKVNTNTPFWNVTLKDLVTHFSSLPNSIPNSPQKIGVNMFADKPMPDWVIQFLDSWTPSYPIGTRYHYSNLGVVLAGNVALTLEGKVYTKLLKEYITGPLGMSHTGVLGIDNSPVSDCAIAHEPNGKPSKHMTIGLWTTADDMLLLIEANLGVLKPSTELAKAIDFTHKKLFQVKRDHAIGMAWERWYHGDSLLISKYGDEVGFSAWVAFEPKQKKGIAILCNGGKKGPNHPEFGKKLLALTDSDQ